MAGISFDSPYNARLRKLVRELDEKNIREPTNMIGGGPLRDTILASGNSPAYPPAQMLAMSGGKRSRVKTAKKWLGAIGDAVGPDIKRAATAAVVRGLSGGKKVNHLKKAKRWLGAIGDAVGPDIKRAASNAVVRGLSGGKKVNHLKKAKRWVAAIGDAVGPDIRHAASNAVVKVLGGRRPMAADDPRRRRAVMVGKIMKEKGLSLPEASKYIKAQGLQY